MLSKKKSRPIEVSGETYRWAVAGDLTFVTLVVQQAQSNGQKLETHIPTDIGRAWLEFPNTKTLNLRSIKPALVSRIILDAIDIGWTPKLKAAPLKLILNEDNKLEVK